MKLVFLFLFVTLTARAADPVVSVESPTSITVNGKKYGKVVDAMANNKALVAPIQKAFEGWFVSLEARHAKELAQVKEAAQAEIARVKEAADRQVAEAAAAARAAKNELTTKETHIKKSLADKLEREKETGIGPKALMLQALLQEAEKPELRIELEKLEAQLRADKVAADALRQKLKNTP